MQVHAEPACDGLTDLDVAPGGPMPSGGRRRLHVAEPEPIPQEAKPVRPRVSRASCPRCEGETPSPRTRIHRPRPGEQKTAASAAPGDGPSEADPAKFQQFMAELRAKQRFASALVGGAVAATVGAILWAATAVTIRQPTGYLALAVGLLVGGAVRVSGRGLDKSFGRLGAGLSIAGCLLGNFLTNCLFIARETDLSLTTVLAHLGTNPLGGLGLMIAVRPLDLVFYTVALYAGYRLSVHRLTKTQVARLPSGHGPGNAATKVSRAA